MLLILLFVVAVTSKIAYVATVIRHGARYPLKNMWDGNQTAAFHGKLTSVGMRQHFLLGGYLKADYIDKMGLINSTLYPKEVQVFTDSSQRCVLSTLSHLMGLFPFGTGPRIPEGIAPEQLDPPYQSFASDNLRKNSAGEALAEYGLKLGYQPTPYINATQFIPSCPNQNSLLTKRIESLYRQIAQFQALQAAFTQKMRIIFNLKTTESNVAGLAELFDVVTCDYYLGRSMPANFTQYDYQQLKYIQNYLFSLTYGGNLAKIFSTPMVQGILGNMDNIVKKGDKEVKKYSLYSGHDTNLMPLLNFLNLTDPNCMTRKWKNETVTGNCGEAPPFAANLILQLHQVEQSQQNQKYVVKIRYDGVYMNVCDSKSLECDYNQFASRVRAQFVDWKSLCGVKTYDEK